MQAITRAKFVALARERLRCAGRTAVILMRLRTEGLTSTEYAGPLHLSFVTPGDEKGYAKCLERDLTDKHELENIVL